MADLLGSSPSDCNLPETNPDPEVESKGKGRSRKTKTIPGTSASAKLATDSTASASTSKSDSMVTRAEVDDIKSNLATLTSSVTQLTTVLSPLLKTMKEQHGEDDEENEDDVSDIGGDQNPQQQGESSSSLEGLDYFQHIAGLTEDTGPKINDTLAKGINNILEIGLTQENVEKLHDKFLVPENCKRLTVVKCNDEIFKHVRKSTRIQDIALQRVQKDLTKSITGLAHAFDSTENNDTKNAIAEAMSLLCNGSHSLDVYRRNCFKPDLKPEYAGLCAEAKPVSETLFGALQEEAKAQAETSKITNQIKKKVSFHPYKKPFLGVGGLQHKKGGGKHYNPGRPFNKFNNNYNSYNNSNNYNNKKKKTHQERK